jgi:hypothetical protein
MTKNPYKREILIVLNPNPKHYEGLDYYINRNLVGCIILFKKLFREKSHINVNEFNFWGHKHELALEPSLHFDSNAFFISFNYQASEYPNLIEYLGEEVCLNCVECLDLVFDEYTIDVFFMLLNYPRIYNLNFIKNAQRLFKFE